MSKSVTDQKHLKEEIKYRRKAEKELVNNAVNSILEICEINLSEKPLRNQKAKNLRRLSKISARLDDLRDAGDWILCIREEQRKKAIRALALQRIYGTARHISAAQIEAGIPRAERQPSIRKTR